MRVAIGLNAALALLLELALLVAAVAIGLAVPGPLLLRVALAVLLPAAVVVVWAVWMAPRAARRLPARNRLLLETVLLALAVVGLAATGAVAWALALTVLAAVRLLLGARLGRV